MQYKFYGFLHPISFYRIVCQVESPRNLTTGIGRGAISGPIVVKVQNDYIARSRKHYSFVVSFYKLFKCYASIINLMKCLKFNFSKEVFLSLSVNCGE